MSENKLQVCAKLVPFLRQFPKMLSLSIDSNAFSFFQLQDTETYFVRIRRLADFFLSKVLSVIRFVTRKGRFPQQASPMAEHAVAQGNPGADGRRKARSEQLQIVCPCVVASFAASSLHKKSCRPHEAVQQLCGWCKKNLQVIRGRCAKLAGCRTGERKYIK
jgi:hypothetical protein